jgi:hypothetical protein
VSATQKDWKAAAWTLEKMFPAEFRGDEPKQPLGVTILYDMGGKSMQELLDFPTEHDSAEVGREKQARLLGQTVKAPSQETAVTDAPPREIVRKRLTDRIAPERRSNGPKMS